MDSVRNSWNVAEQTAFYQALQVILVFANVLEPLARNIEGKDHGFFGIFAVLTLVLDSLRFRLIIKILCLLFKN